MPYIPYNFPALAEVWPGLSYSLADLSTAHLYRNVLAARMKCFINSTKLMFNYHAKVVNDFNEWIRFQIPAYYGRAKLTDIFDLPIISRKEFRQAPDQFRSVDYDPHWSWIKKTSGSSGPPLAINYSCCFHHETTLLAVPKISYRLGLTPGTDNQIYTLTIRDKPTEGPIVRFDTTGYGGLSIRVGVNTMSPESIHRVLMSSTKGRPFCISSNPSVLTIISEIISPKLARSTGVKLIVNGGAALPEKTRSQLELMFQAKVCSAYGLSEVGIVASECKFGRMHFNTCDCYPEVLSEDAQSPEAADKGEIVVTSTSNKLMPFLRYRTGDLGRLSLEPCPCGEPSPILDELSGRITPVFRLPSGTLFSPTQFRDTFERFGWLKELQVIQEKIDLVRVLYEVANNEKITADEELCLRDHFAHRLGRDVDVRLQEHLFEQNCNFQRYKTLID